MLKQLETIVRWAARIGSIAIVMLVAAFMFGGAEHFRPTADEAVGLLLFPGGVILGFAIAWRWEGTGGLVTLASLGLFYLWIYNRQGQFGGPYFLLFAAPGFLFAASAVMEAARRRNRPLDGTA